VRVVEIVFDPVRGGFMIAFARGNHELPAVPVFDRLFDLYVNPEGKIMTLESFGSRIFLAGFKFRNFDLSLGYPEFPQEAYKFDADGSYSGSQNLRIVQDSEFIEFHFGAETSTAKTYRLNDSLFVILQERKVISSARFKYSALPIDGPVEGLKLLADDLK
jgi:hypothetical protein